MSFTLHTLSGALACAGANTNATITADTTTLNLWSDEAEAMICDVARYNLVDNYSSLTSYGKIILSSVCDGYVGQKIINYQPESIGLIGATLRLNLLQTKIEEGVNLIKDEKIKTYLQINT